MICFRSSNPDCVPTLHYGLCSPRVSFDSRLSLRPAWWQSWRTRWRWAAALWTARTPTPPSKTCQAYPSAPRRAATWRWSRPCPESERTPRSARRRSTRPPCTEVSEKFFTTEKSCPRLEEKSWGSTNNTVFPVSRSHQGICLKKKDIQAHFRTLRDP